VAGNAAEADDHAGVLDGVGQSVSLRYFFTR
jgi:hypothetical protein